jgi:signal transduction histidine kinase/CheY-like chemotaxis protein
MEDTLQEVFQTGKGHFISNTRKDAREWYFEHYVFPDETNPGGLMGFAKDITDRRRMEQESKDAKEAAEKASQSKSRFLANMSHEIRTPISAILGFANLLKKQDLSPESLEYLSYITSSGEILLKLIGDVLDLTKIEEGKFELQLERFHLKEVLTSNLSPYGFRANEKGLQFELLFDENLPSYAIGDASKLSQIVINLIGNALKFTKQGGIKISFTAERPAKPEQTILLKVSITDTGIGISPDKLALIFQSFTQADVSINREFGGSGLGLSIVKELVERMGGQIGVESHINKNSEVSGSTFWFTIPLREAEAPTVSSESEQQILENIDYKGEVHVLLVDDNEINQRLASIMLQNMGCKVTIAGNGQEAIEKLPDNDFQLILMDIQMPLMNGYEATEYMRNKVKLTLPIIGLSANVYKEEIEQCYQSGMNDYLGKPYTEKKLREKVAEMGARIYKSR